MTFPETPQVNLAVGIPSVDHEHEDLMREIARLLGQPGVRLDSEHFSEIMSRLGQLLAEHFRHEESVLQDCGVPADDALAHHRAHREILEQYTELQLDLMAKVPLDAQDVCEMIRTWVIEHQMTHDLRLRRYAGRAE